ncbi:MAG: hypothetical protein KJ052_04140 [Candidatus Hydrogenedentes bacterium]|nr:hypothetical protein [Candidatus Hydrogenedentota bacterium]
MARKISGKILVEANMTAQTPICIGGMGAGDAVDLEIMVNGKDKPFIPGTSLMGPMRAWFEQRLDRKNKTLAEVVFGYQEEDKGQASFLLVEDAELKLPGDLAREIRDGIGIDSHTGVAEEGKKFTRAVLPRGTSFTLKLELDVPKVVQRYARKGNNENRKEYEPKEFAGALRLLLEHLRDDGLRVGASKTRGLGKLGASDIKAAWYKFPDDLDAWLNQKEMRAFSEVLKNDAEAPTPEFKDHAFLDIRIEWKPISPVMVKSGADGGIADMLPLVSGYESGKVAPVIPGSSVKGVLRARAEKILRTLKGDLPEDRPDFLSEDLFGSTEAAGRLFVDDTYQKDNQISAQDWIAETPKVMNDATDHHDHVAIDRFTGGASDSALFNDRTPKRGKAWQPINIRVDFARHKVKMVDGEIKTEELTENEKYRAAALVLLLLRDMQAGWIPLGFGSCRGMGEIEVKKIKINGKVDGESFNGDTLEQAMGKAALQTAWRTFVNGEGNNNNGN